ALQYQHYTSTKYQIDFGILQYSQIKLELSNSYDLQLPSQHDNSIS
ncbi:MAG: hypothetical protein ACI9FB_003538, partial [Candidatus Azotimanducaceae bacterium]